MDDRLAFALILGGLHSLAFFGTLGVFALMFHRGLLSRYQVAGGRAPDAALNRRALIETGVNHPLFAVACYFLVYPLWLAAGGRFAGLSGDAKGALEVVPALAFFIVVNDTVFYWSHRLLHTRTLFRRIHAQHHRFRYVRGASAEFSHPVENLANFVAFFAGPCLIGGPFVTLCLWVVIRMVETVDAHSGYALNSSSSRHAFHHLYAAKGCYGSFFGLWDRLMGTDRQWRRWRNG